MNAAFFTRGYQAKDAQKYGQTKDLSNAAPLQIENPIPGKIGIPESVRIS